MYKVVGKLLLLALCAAGVFGQNCPRIVTKEEWGSIGGSSSPVATTVTYAVVHHSVGPACDAQIDCSALVKAIQIEHMTVNGWDDIGLNFLIGGDGNVYEGRGWGKLGAHTVGMNSNSVGIEFLGSFTSYLPTEAALAAAKQLLECGVALGELADDYKLIGHLQATSTDCPGASLQSEIQTWDHWHDVSK